MATTPKLFSMKIFRLNKNNERESCVKDVAITPTLENERMSVDKAEVASENKTMREYPDVVSEANSGKLRTNSHEIENQGDFDAHITDTNEDGGDTSEASTGSDIITSDSDKDVEGGEGAVGSDADAFTVYARQVLACTVHRCPICDAEFCGDAELQTHTTLHYDKLTPSCAACKQVFSTAEEREQHTKYKHARKSPATHRCCQCGEKHSTRRAFEMHLRTHSNKPYSCSSCDMRLESSAELSRHEKNHRLKKRYRCAYCGHPFLRKCDLLEHRAKHENKQFECPLCDQVLPRARDLKSHVITCHSEQLPFRCDVCFSRFLRQSHLDTHKKTHNW